MVTTLAKLHSINYKNLGLSDFGQQTNYLRRQVIKILQHFANFNLKNRSTIGACVGYKLYQLFKLVY